MTYLQRLASGISSDGLQVVCLNFAGPPIITNMGTVLRLEGCIRVELTNEAHLHTYHVVIRKLPRGLACMRQDIAV